MKPEDINLADMGMFWWEQEPYLFCDDPAFDPEVNRCPGGCGCLCDYDQDLGEKDNVT